MLEHTQLSQIHVHYNTNSFLKATGLGQIEVIYDFMSCQDHHGEGEGGLAGAKEHKKYSNMTTYLQIIQIFDFSFPSSGNFNRFSPKLKDENSTYLHKHLSEHRSTKFPKPWVIFKEEKH